MTPIEQAREALTAIRKASAMDAVVMSAPPAAVSRFADMHQHADAALAALSPSTPVDGVGAEPRVKPLEWAFGETKVGDGLSVWAALAEGLDKTYSVWHSEDPDATAPYSVPCIHNGFFQTLADAKAAAQADYERRVLSALANPEAEARLRERVADSRWENQARQATSVIAMIRAMIGEMFGPVIESEEATLLRGPEAKHSGEAILEALQKIEARLAQAEGGPAVTGAAQDVLAERRRQVETEGWTPAHDDTHASGEMGRAAGIYALAASDHDYRWVLRGLPTHDYLTAAMKLWPWDWSWFKPTNRRRDLVKAGALILAEIERLDRAALHPQSAAGEEGK